MSEIILTAIVIGLAAGINPGPLSVLVIQQTLEHGFRQGVRVSMTPLITDGPIILLSMGLLNYFSGGEHFIAVISLLGGVYLLHLAKGMLFSGGLVTSGAPELAIGLVGMLKVNILNPNPYLFWITVGGAYIDNNEPLVAVNFVLVLLVMIVLSKVLIACVTRVFKEQVKGRLYLWITRGLGLVLATYGGIFLRKSYLAVIV